MAKKRTPARRRRSTGYTVGTKRIRRRKMNGARSGTRRRRIGSAGSSMQSTLTSTLKIAVGALAGGVVIGMSEKLIGNFYVRAGATAALGVAIAKMMPKAKEIGIGVAVAGVVGAGHKALTEANILPVGTGSMNGNGRKRLTPEQLRMLTAKMKAAGTINASNGTLNAGRDRRMIVSSAERMFA